MGLINYKEPLSTVSDTDRELYPVFLKELKIQSVAELMEKQNEDPLDRVSRLEQYRKVKAMGHAMLALAKEAGLVVTLENVPNVPLETGKYTPVLLIRSAREAGGTYRPIE